MDPHDADRFNDSYERCIKDPEFLERFYAIFMASSPEVAEKFANTDIRKQAIMLKGSLFVLMGMSPRSPETDAYFHHVAELHSKRQLDIRPELYDLWLRSLLQAAAEFDPQLDEATVAAWYKVLGPGIETMKARYNGSQPPRRSL